MDNPKKPAPAPLFRGLQPNALPPEEMEIGRSLRAAPKLPLPTQPLIDLRDKPKLILVIGAGRSGCTTFLRWAAEMAWIRDPDCKTVFGAVGDRRDLKLYVQGVVTPEDGAGQDVFNPAQEALWLEALVAHCMEEHVSAAIDFDGGDTTLFALVEKHVDVCEMVQKAGVSVVAIYLLTPRVTDLTTLATLQKSGFQPPATALVLNEGTTSRVPDGEFAAITGHSAFRAAAARGAAVIRMPRLFVASKLESGGWRDAGFSGARDGAPQGQDGPPLSVIDRWAVRAWLSEMEERFDPLLQASWLG